MSEITLTFLSTGKTLVVPFNPQSELALTIGPMLKGATGQGIELTIVDTQEAFDSAVSEGLWHWIIRV